MNIKGIPISDIFQVASIALVLILGWAHANAKKLPKPAAQWLAKLGEQDILDSITAAMKLSGLDEAGRKAWVVERLQREAQRKLGFQVPDSIMNLLVEWVYNKVKKPAKLPA